MTKALKGEIVGGSREQIVSSAKTKSRMYFGTDCVAVSLDNEKPVEDGKFSATFTGVVWHDLDHRSYGPDECKGCGKKSWPSDPLNPVKPEEWE